jgi:ligand-binding SRPBCC domain-containing protein
MKVHILSRQQYLDRPLEDVFGFFSEARNLERLTPSWLSFRVLSQDPAELGEGTLIRYALKVHGVPLRWVSRIESWEPNVRFVDRQLTGPYALWHHTHEFAALGEGTLISDTVRYSLGFGVLGEVARAVQVQRDLDNIFDYRRTAVLEALS